ncbi:MAG: dynamin family protein [Chloroflexi bacterium]|nr:dynamin family protein [Chloroflexota bacterium]MCC6895589.1 dynamin family protein [Anaerolineae bacterium]
MMSNTLDGTLAALREEEIRLLTDIGSTLAEMGDASQEDRQRLLDVANDLREMFFLVVIIGEFNAGKSSFINALLGDTLLPTGITPTTEAIELIHYGDLDRKPTMREDDIRVWSHPNTGAPGVALVDTPGTGSVFAKHETTAKSFLHRSDLIIFLISAKRAFAETERMYLELAKKYGKKIVLVVNQIDLLQPKEQVEVRRFIEQQASELLDMRPLMFMVSAREALNAKSNGNVVGDPGGIDAVRAHLRGVLNEAPPAQQKLLAQLDMATHLVTTAQTGIQRKADVVNIDTIKVREVQKELEQQSLGLEGQLKAARAEMDSVFEGMRQRGMNFIDTNLSFRKIGRTPKREVLQSEFQEVVIGRALRDINDATNGYINAVVDSSRLYWRSVIDRLNQLRELMEQEVTGLDSGVYAEQREALQDAIRIAESELKTYSTGKLVAEMQDIFETNSAGFTTSVLASVGGLILILLALAPAGPILGVGAAPLAFPAFIVGAPIMAVGGIYAYRYFRGVVNDTKADLHKRIDDLQKSYQASLDELTQKERNRLSQYGKQVLIPIYSRLEVLSQRYAAQQAALRAHITQLGSLRENIERAK